MIEILRLNHRIARDKRISTHVALTARAFSGSKVFYSGQKDKEMEYSINRIVNKFGGNFFIEYVKDDLKLIKEKKKKNFLICHLTMYGLPFEKELKNLKNKNLLVVVGGEKVEGKIYELSDYNLSVGSQPISEVSSLGIFLYSICGEAKFKNGKVYIVPQRKGKLLKERKR